MANSSPSIEDLLINENSKSAQSALDKKIHNISLKDKEKETEQQASVLGLPYVNLKGFPIAPEALVLMEKQKAIDADVVVFYYDEKEMRIATTDPKKETVTNTLKKLKKEYSANVALYLVSQNSFEYAIAFYDNLPQIKEIQSGVDVTEEDLIKWQKEISDYKKLQAVIQKASLTDIITIVIASSLQSKSSDIHIEAEEKEIKIRFRIDGVLNTVAVLPHKLWRKIISRIKLLSGMKMNIDTIPQDGRFTINMKNDKVDVRVSTIPTSYGESVVMRLLKSSSVGLPFEELGLRKSEYEKLEHEILKPNGMIITTGPTGSGKTTTLYAILNKLNDEETKIITLENPVEYKLKGINQSQIDHSRDYTFAKGLRSILRQDPDIVMVGEIRDNETAEIAVNAALTGHLVVSTIHTNSAAGTIPRFLAMDTPPFLLAPAINAIIGQRLVRKLCPDCKEEIELDSTVMKKVKTLLDTLPENFLKKNNLDLKNLKFFTAKGCDKCHDVGYKGRIGIYEIMIMTPEIEKLTLAGQATEYELQKIATKDGMITMAQDGVLKAIEGTTSIEEVFKKAE